MKGKIVAITGTTSGTGYQVAKYLGMKGARVLLLNRKSSRSEASEKKLKEEVKDGLFTTVVCDLQDFESVRGAAQQVLKILDGKPLNALGLNAGIMAMPDKATKDGYDVQMQTNHLSHFLLAQNLLPALKKSADSTGDAAIVSMSSLARKGRPLEEKYLGKNGGNLGGNKGGMNAKEGPWQRYHQTKLANCVFTYALHQRIQDSKDYKAKIRAVVAHPGLSATNLQTTTNSHGNMPGWFGPIYRWMAQSSEDGAAGFLEAMASKEVKSGTLFGPVKYSELCGPPVVIKPEKYLNDKESMDMLWSASEQATEVKFTI